MNKSESINEIAAALSKAQAEITGAVKDSKNPHFKSDFASLASVLDCIRVPFSKNGLSVVQTMEDTEGHRRLSTTLMHSSGQFISSSLSLILQKQDMQGIGSAITYARRYSLAAMAGVSQVDDDGNAASDKGAGDIGADSRIGNGIIPKQTTATISSRSYNRKSWAELSPDEVNDKVRLLEETPGLTTEELQDLETGRTWQENHRNNDPEVIPNCPKCGNPFGVSNFPDARKIHNWYCRKCKTTKLADPQ